MLRNFNRYVCETLANRVIKFYLGQNTNNVFTIFYQFSGRLGPRAITVGPKGNIFVALFEFGSQSNEGLIAVLSPEGNYIRNLNIPGYPEIQGISFTRYS